MKNWRLSASGFSLVEVMMAAGLLGVIAYGLMAVSEQQYKQVKGTQVRFEEDAILNEIRVLLAHPTACQNSLQGQSLSQTGLSISSLRDKDGNVRFPRNQKLGYSGLRIQQYGFEDYDDQTETVKFMVTFDRGFDQGKSTMKKGFSLSVTADSGNLDECASSSASHSGPWIVNQDNTIYYTANDVAIGTASPKAKLDVDGDIKMGNSEATCDSDTEGSQRYYSPNKKMQFCNGTDWVNIRQGDVQRTVAENTGTCPAGDWTDLSVTCPADQILTGASCWQEEPNEPKNYTQIHSYNGQRGVTCRFGCYDSGSSQDIKVRAICLGLN